MYQIEIAVTGIESAGELFKIAEEDDNIVIITEKNFNGDITMIELYFSLSWYNISNNTFPFFSDYRVSAERLPSFLGQSCLRFGICSA